MEPEKSHNLDRALTEVPNVSAAGTCATGRRLPRIGIKRRPAPPPHTRLTIKATTANKKRNGMLN
jgi:hypothetical protein